MLNNTVVVAKNGMVYASDNEQSEEINPKLGFKINLKGKEPTQLEYADIDTVFLRNGYTGELTVFHGNTVKKFKSDNEEAQRMYKDLLDYCQYGVSEKGNVIHLEQ